MRAAGEAGRPLVIISGGGRSASLAAGFDQPPGYYGLAGLLYREPQSPLSPVSFRDREIDVIFPAPESLASGSQVELLDRARYCVEGYHAVFVTVDLRRLETDLPPCAPSDRVECFWEVGDALGEASLQAFGRLFERLDSQPAKLKPLQLYARHKARAESAATDVAAIRTAAGMAVQRDLTTLEDGRVCHPILQSATQPTRR